MLSSPKTEGSTIDEMLEIIDKNSIEKFGLRYKQPKKSKFLGEG